MNAYRGQKQYQLSIGMRRDGSLYQMVVYSIRIESVPYNMIPWMNRSRVPRIKKKS
jgi:hypothetical protein